MVLIQRKHIIKVWKNNPNKAHMYYILDRTYWIEIWVHLRNIVCVTMCEHFLFMLNLLDKSNFPHKLVRFSICTKKVCQNPKFHFAHERIRCALVRIRW